MNGLLGSQSQAPQSGGLLGGGMPQQAQGSSEGLKMAMMLSQNPTPETVQAVIGMAQKSGNPQADQLVQTLLRLETPESIKMFADQVIQKLQG